MNKSFSISPVLVCLLTLVFAILSIIPNSKAQTYPAVKTADMVIWLNPENGMSATLWKDQSGKNNDFIGSSGKDGPLVVQSIINGHDAMEFDFTRVSFNPIYHEDFMYSNRSILSNDHNYTIFAVFQPELKDDMFLLGKRSDHDGLYLEINLSYQKITHDIFSANPTLLRSNEELDIHTPYLLSTVYGNGTGASTVENTLSIQGETIVSNSNNLPYTAGPLNLGSALSSTGELELFSFHGYISEVLVYDEALSDTEISRVESYLAMKYALSLDQSTPQDYVDSNGNSVWTAITNAGYGNKIIGIGKDDGTSLNQNSSESMDNTVSPGIRISKETPFATSDNGIFLLMGDNGKNGNAPSNFPPPGINPIGGALETIWKVQETGDTGDLTITIDLKNTIYSCITNPMELYLIRDTDDDFTTTSTTTQATSIANGKVIFENINLKDGEYIGLAERKKYFASISYISDGEENNSGSTVPIKYKVELKDNQGKSVQAPSGVDINLEIDSNNSDAVAGSDFKDTTPYTAKFNVGETETQFELEVLNDADLEGPEIVIVKVSDNQPIVNNFIYTKGCPENVATGFIHDADKIIELHITPKTQGNEAGKKALEYNVATVDVTDPNNPKPYKNIHGPVEVNFEYDGGTAKGGAKGSSGIDFENDVLKTTIANNKNSGIIKIPVIDDTLDEGPETVILKLTDRSTSGVIMAANPANRTATNTLLDDDLKVEVRITKKTDGAEDNGSGATTPATFEVTLWNVSDNDPTKHTKYTNPAGDITVTYAFDSKGNAKGGTTAGSGIDYDNSKTKTVPIASGSSTGTITVQVFEDTDKEGPEDIIVEIKSVDQGIIVPKVATNKIASADILDDDISLAVNITSSTDGAEDGTGGTPTAVEFEVTLYDVTDPANPVEFTNIGGPITVSVDLTGTATGGTALPSDYDNSKTTTVTIANGQSKGTLSLDVFEDTAKEGPESVIATLENPSGGVGLGADITKTANIVDDDIKLEARIEKKADGNEEVINGKTTPATFTVTLWDVTDTDQTKHVPYTNSGGDITVTYAFDSKGNAKGGTTAGSGIDYDNSKTKTVPIASGSSTGTITVPVFEDTDKEGPEDIIVEIKSVDQGIIVPKVATNKIASADILDDDISLAVNITSSTDGAEDGTGGTPTAVEFEVTLYDVTDPANPAEFTNIGGPITVSVDLTGTANGATAANPVLSAGDTDYDNSKTTVTIANGQSKGTLSLDVFEDTAGEGPESVIATLMNPSGGVGLGADKTKTANIADDDLDLEVRIEKKADGNEAGEVAATFEVTLWDVSDIDPTKHAPYTNPGGDITVTYAFSGNATQGTTTTEDYDASRTTVEIANNAKTGTISVPVNDDNDKEGPEDIIVTITGVDSGVAVAATATDATASADILDDDISLAVNITSTTNGAEAGTGGTPTAVEFEVTLYDVTVASNPVEFTNIGGPITVSVDLTGTAIGGTGLPSDYDNSKTTTVTIANGDETGTLTLDVFQDTAAEGPESVIATLMNPSGGVGLGADKTKTTNIADDDLELEARIEKKADGNEAGEVAATFEVTLWDVSDIDPTKHAPYTNPGGDITVTYAFSGNATQGTTTTEDYDASRTTVEIANNAKTGTISVQVNDDNDKEGPEDIIVTITGVDSGVAVAATATDATASADILDDDISLAVNITSSTNGAEAGTGGTPTEVEFEVTLYDVTDPANPVEFTNIGGPITVSVDLTGTATGGTALPSDYDNSKTTTVTIANGDETGTLTLDVFQDTAAEGPESVIATLMNPSGGVGLGADKTKTANIADDDLELEARIEKKADGNEAGEVAATFEVTLWDVSDIDPTKHAPYTNPGGDITVTYAFSGNATQGTTTTEDYDASTTTVTIANNAEMETISVPVNDDNDKEGPEDIIVTITGVDSGVAVAATATDATASADILDDDISLAVNITSTTNGAEAGTGGTPTAVEFEVTLYDVTVASNPVEFTNIGGPITVSVDLTGTATGGTALPSDYDNSKTTTVTIAKGASKGTLSLDVFEDTVAEGPETVIATLMNPSGGVGLGADKTKTANIADDDLELEARIEKKADGNEAGEVAATFEVTLWDVSDIDPTKHAPYTNPGGDITVTYAFSGNATQGTTTTEDYDASTTTVTIANNAEMETISVPVNDDNDKEGPEDIIVTITGVDSGVAVAATATDATASADILDDDISLAVNITSTTNGAEAGTGGTPTAVEFEVTLYDVTVASNPVEFTNIGGPITVSVDLTGTATGGTALPSDYDNSKTTTVTIAKGASKGTLSLDVFEDTVAEGPETVIATLMNPSGGVGLGVAADITKTANIADDDIKLEARIKKKADGNEAGEVAATFEVTLWDVSDIDPTKHAPYTNPGGDITVTYAFSGNATQGTTTTEDYDASRTTVTIANNAETGTISVPVNDDNDIEGPEDIIVTITGVDSGVAVAATATDATASADIIDDDQPLDVIITASTNGAEAGTGGTPTAVTFTVTLVEDGTKTPFANNGGDFTVDVTLTGTATGATAAEPTTPGNVGNNDYDNSTKKVTIANGQSTGVLTLPVFEDTAGEGPETVIATLMNPSGGVGLGAAADITKTANIADDDLKLEVRIAETKEGNEENNVSAEFTVTLYDVSDVDPTKHVPYTNPGGDITVNYGFSGTATGGAAAGLNVMGENIDYNNSTTSVTIAKGSSTGTITLPIFDDGDKEGPETITVKILTTNPSVLYPKDLANTMATTNIIDNDQLLDVIITASTDGAEDGTGTPTPVTFTVTLVESGSTTPYTNNGGDITVMVDLTGTASGGTALPSDYDNSKPTATIASGQSKGILSLDVFEDTAKEAYESVTATLTSASSGVGLGNSTDITKTANIADDDLKLELIFDTSASTAGNEQGPVAATAKVVLVEQGTTMPVANTGSPFDVMYSFEPDNGTAGVAVGGSDYTNTGNKITIATGESEKTITVPIIDDAVKNEGDETLTVKLDNRTTGVLVGTTDEATLTITDNDVEAIDEPDLDPKSYVVNPAITDPNDPNKNTIRGTATIGTKVKVTLDGTDYEVVATADPNDPNKGLFKVDIPANISEGTYDVAVESRRETTDGRVLVKNPTNGPKVFDDALVIDKTAPDENDFDITRNTDTNGDGDDDTLIVNEDDPKLTGVVGPIDPTTKKSGNVGGTVTITITDPGGNPVTDVNGTPVGSLTATINPDGTYTTTKLPVNLEDDTYTIKATITDPAGNVSPTKTIDNVLVIDTTKPDSDDFSIGNTDTDGDGNDDTLIVKDKNPELTGVVGPIDTTTGNSYNGGGTVKITIKDSNGNPATDTSGNPIGSVTATINTDGTYTTPNIPADLPDGTYTIEATITDLAGNVSDPKKTISNGLVIDTDAPDANDFSITGNTDTNGDGDDDTLVVKDKNPELTGVVGPIDPTTGDSGNVGGTVTITITDGSGNPATDTNGNPVDPVTATINTDGTYTTPNLPTDLPDGTYTIEATITDPAGNVSNPKKTITDGLVIDTAAPDANDFSITGNTDTNGDGDDDTLVVKDKNPELTGVVGPIDPTTGDSGNVGGTVTITITDGSGNPATDTNGNPVDPVTATINTDGTYTTPNLPTDLPDGTYTIEATITDPAGNVSNPKKTITDGLVIDTAAPDANDFSITGNTDTDGDGDDDTLVVKDKNPELTGVVGPIDPTTGDSGNVGGTVTITITDGSGNPATDTNGNPVDPVTATINTDGTYTTPNLPTDLPDGTYTIEATITDPAGNVSDPKKTIPNGLVIDTTPPDPDDFSIGNTDTDGDGNDDTLIVKDTAPELTGVVGPIDPTTKNSGNVGGTVTITIKDSNGNPATDTSGNPIGAVTATINPDGTYTTPKISGDLPEGSYRIEATITDPVGNVSKPKIIRDGLVIDTTPPDPNDFSIGNTDTDGDGDPDTLIVKDTAPELTGVVGPIDPTTKKSGNVGGTVTITITDAGGNPATDTSGNPIGPVTTTINPDGTYTTPKISGDLPEGTYTVKATITDPAGNVSPPKTIPNGLVIDTTPPDPNDLDIDLNFDTDGDGVDDAVVVNNTNNPGLTGVAGPIDATTGKSDNGGGTVTIIIKDSDGNPATDTSGNPVDPITTTINPDGTYTTPKIPTDLPDGTYTIDATITDPAGNVSPPKTIPNGLVIDTTVPDPDDFSITENTDTDGDGDPDTLVVKDKKPELTGVVGPIDPTTGNSDNGGGTVTIIIKDSDGNPATDTSGSPVDPITTTINPDGTYTTPKIPTDLPDGTYTIDAVVTDPVGNVSPPKIIPDGLVIDTTPPSVDDFDVDLNIDTDGDGVNDAVVVNNMPPGLTGVVGPIDPTTGKSDNGGGTVTIIIKDSDGNPVTDTSGNPVDPITTTINPDGTWEIPDLPDDLDDGTYSIDATINDPAGNPSDPIKLPDVLVIDNSAPTEDDLHVDFNVDTDGDGDPDTLVVTEQNPGISGTVDPINPDATSTGTVSVVIKDKDGNPVFDDPVTATINPDGTWKIPSFPEYLEPGEYDIEVTITDLAGNTTDPAIKIPKAINIIDLNPLSNNGISPNGDGINDFWFIHGIEQHKNNSVGVFNRWGKEVWSMDGYNNDDKVFRGERNKGLGKSKVPVGTYFYSIDLGDGSKKKLGYIAVYY